VAEAIAFCGLDCDRCPAYLATQRADRSALERIAARWSAESGMEISADSILCDGCRAESGRINAFCAVCGIRSCASGRGLDTRAPCGDYPCGKLRGFPPFESEGRANLDRLRGEAP
jgi:Protein of unknown function (DUF3795)